MAVNYTNAVKSTTNAVDKEGVAALEQVVKVASAAAPTKETNLATHDVFLALLNAQTCNRDSGHWKAGNAFDNRVAELKDMAKRIVDSYANS